MCHIAGNIYVIDGGYGRYYGDRVQKFTGASEFSAVFSPRGGGGLRLTLQGPSTP